MRKVSLSLKYSIPIYINIPINANSCWLSSTFFNVYRSHVSVSRISCKPQKLCTCSQPEGPVRSALRQRPWLSVLSKNHENSTYQYIHIRNALECETISNLQHLTVERSTSLKGEQPNKQPHAIMQCNLSSAGEASGFFDIKAFFDVGVSGAFCGNGWCHVGTGQSSKWFHAVGKPHFGV